MTKTDAARIHSSNAKKQGGQVPKGDFTGRAQRAAEKNGQ